MNNDVFRINDMPYEFTIILRNSGGSIVLNKTLFRELNIHESFDTWKSSGFLIYDNSYEQLERSKSKRNVKNSEFFYFRMDGTDEIIIEFTPILDANSSKSNKALNDFPSDILKFEFKGIVFDTEDLSKSTIENKLKKIYFWNYDFNTATNLNSRVSSGEYLSLNASKDTSVVQDMSNRSRFISNGKLLKYICTTKLGVTVSDTFEDGDNATFYVSPNSNTVYDDMNTLINEWFDADGYPGHFYYDRFTGEYNLKSYKTLFENYPTDKKEIMVFPDPTKPNSSILPIRNDTINTFSWPVMSKIRSYKYSKMAGSDSNAIINSRSVSGYISKSKKFLVHGKNGNINDVKEAYKTLLNGFSEGNKNPIIITNKDKIDNKKLLEHYTLNPQSFLAVGIESALLLNDAIDIELIGVPNRVPGTFIEITSDTDMEGIWEDRFLGTWLIVKVEHKITTESYLNKILAVKVNMSESFPYPDGIETKKQEFETVEGKQ